jgi:hypothetical protein
MEVLMVYTIDNEIGPEVLERRDVPLLIRLATPYEGQLPANASGIADEGGGVTMFWTQGLATQPDGRPDSHADYAPGQ